MKRFMYVACVDNAAGTQTFYIDAKTREEADRRAENGDTDGIMFEEVEVQSLTSLEYDGETTLDDYGDFPPGPSPHERHVAELEAANKEWVDKTDFVQSSRLPAGMLGVHRADILRMQLERCLRLFDEALPKFNWGASFLDANAIDLLNTVPGEVRAMLGKGK